jgi:hypothetical protein
MSLLEQLRQSQEDVETIEKAVSRCLLDKDKFPAMGASADHAVVDLAKQARDIAQQALSVYRDEDQARREEIAYLTGTNGDVWANFYEKVKETKDYYRKHADQPCAKAPQVRDVTFFYEQALSNDASEARFSGEEAFGQHLDLQQHYTAWLNLKKLKEDRMKKFYDDQVTRMRKRMPDDDPEEVEKAARAVEYEEVDYLTWLAQFERFHEVPRYAKYAVPEYGEYLDNLTTYLTGAFERFFPLSNLKDVQDHFDEEFEGRWTSGAVPGWVLPTHKEPLFCLPTNRLFVSEGTRNSHMAGKMYKKKLAAMQKLPLAEQQKVTEDTLEDDKTIAKKECLIQKMRDIFSDILDATTANLQKKQSRTVEEMEAALEEMEDLEDDEEVEPEEDDKEIDKPIYNPLNLPLGFDGKPIPFWLYKLHGLGQEYKCEICGNYSYWGRRAFDRHFQEWRHTYGMRTLKIPNTMHFKDVTKIEEAVRLYDKLKRDAHQQQFDPQNEMECEDASGNVMSYRAYNDLKRQGLV